MGSRCLAPFSHKAPRECAHETPPLSTTAVSARCGVGLYRDWSPDSRHYVTQRVSWIDIRRSFSPSMNGKRHRVQRYCVGSCNYVPPWSWGLPNCAADRRTDPIRTYRRLGTFCYICALSAIVPSRYFGLDRAKNSFVTFFCL
jgi:hypothetical protein